MKNINNKLKKNNFYNNKNINIKNSEKIIFILEDNFNEIKKYNKIIELIKEKYLLENNKINILFIKSKNGINFNLLKNTFNKYKILGKIKLKKENFYGINIRK